MGDPSPCVICLEATDEPLVQPHETQQIPHCNALVVHRTCIFRFMRRNPTNARCPCCRKKYVLWAFVPLHVAMRNVGYFDILEVHATMIKHANEEKACITALVLVANEPMPRPAPTPTRPPRYVESFGFQIVHRPPAQISRETETVIVSIVTLLLAGILLFMRSQAEPKERS